MSQYNSPYFNFDVIQELTEEACSDPERLLTELGINWSLQGKKYAGPCPVHGGDNPGAFNFYHDGETVKGIWICRTHQCHLKYKKTLVGLIRGIKSREGKSYSWQQAVDWLVNFTHHKDISDVKLPDPGVIARRKSARVVYKLANNVTPNKTGWTRDWVRKQLDIPADYYVGRGYSKEILDKYDIGYYKANNRISVPVYDEDYKFCVGFSARSTNNQCDKCGMYHGDVSCPVDGEEKKKYFKWINSKNFETSKYLYNYWWAKSEINKTGVAVLVEGPGDVWKFEESGVKNSLGIFGVDITDYQRNILDSSGALSLIIMLDNDEAGIEASKILKKKLGRAYRLFFPRFQGKDVGDLNSDIITGDIKPYIDRIIENDKNSSTIR